MPVVLRVTVTGAPTLAGWAPGPSPSQLQPGMPVTRTVTVTVTGPPAARPGRPLACHRPGAARPVTVTVSLVRAMVTVTVNNQSHESRHMRPGRRQCGQHDSAQRESRPLAGAGQPGTVTPAGSAGLRGGGPGLGHCD